MATTAYDIIKRPIITEQSMAETEAKKYTFEVAKSANKIEIAKAVEEIFGVKVAKVNTLNMQGNRSFRQSTVPCSWSSRLPSACLLWGGSRYRTRQGISRLCRRLRRHPHPYDKREYPDSS